MSITPPKTNDSNPPRPMIVTPTKTDENFDYSNYDEHDEYYEQDLEEIRNPLYNDEQWCLRRIDYINSIRGDRPL
ncbi:11038_t:CDS:2, partial [Gigaspora rosea]